MKNQFEKFSSEEKTETEKTKDQESVIIKKEKEHGVSGVITLYTTDKENFCSEEESSRISEKGNLFTKKWECGCYNDSDGKIKLCDKHKELPKIERRDYVITKKSPDGKWLENAEVSTTYMDILRSRIEKSLEKNKGMWQKIWDVAELLGVERE